MEDYTRQRIQLHLRNEEVQARILENIHRSRADATVTIGRAAQLSGFSESKLRDLESQHMLNPMRSKENKGTREGKGQRQYPLEELDKLAVIQELLESRFALSDIPKDIGEIWDEILPEGRQGRQLLESAPAISEDQVGMLSIDRRLAREKSLLFWRYYAAQALRMSLMLISEFLPGCAIGLILPLACDPVEVGVRTTEDLSRLGESLVGWLDTSGTVHTLLTHNPSFQYETDYCVYPLGIMRQERLLEKPTYHTLIVLDRPDKRSRRLSLDEAYVQTIRRVLAPLYEEVEFMRRCFGPGWHDHREAAADLGKVGYYQDSILEGLADMVVRMGGTFANGRHLWKFSVILLPDNSVGKVPLQERTLVVRAHSKESPYIVGESRFIPQKSRTSVGIRAYQSGRILYRPHISLRERTRAFIDVEGEIQSNVAVPIGGEHGDPLAVLYVVSDNVEAFSLADRQLLRIVVRFIENAITTYDVRLRTTDDLKSLMHTPDVVDTLFNEFRCENDFMRDVEALVSDAHAWEEDIKEEEFVNEEPGRSDVVSFIAIDMDNQIKLARKYGDHTIRLLDRAIGLRIQELIAPLTTRASQCYLYHMYADRFYLILRGYSREKACAKAEQFKVNLARSIAVHQHVAADSALVISEVSAHLAVTSYSHTKLSEFLQEYSSAAEVSAMISQTLDAVLKLGIGEGGNVVMAWNPDAENGIGGYSRWSQLEESETK
ncbi:MerR family transcriptional regulator [Ktedonobacter robiniae]|uniref:HTH merR-type domain-containing protein n=1 Tax=Ktedonobacter robiniae TaxID=2778365 RepID=A0ABQ3UMJ2_9CHLR|nr:MerR family transcriptional regulator [Ktedonobacter robiniae]GHO53964.1 hypothetical protein KSB_24390 [Ktedonobacter robiniae]